MKTVFDFDANLSAKQADAANLTWRSAKEPCFGIFGSDALFEEGYHRFTAAERERLQPVNDGEAWLSGCPSGIQLRFMTNSKRLFFRGRLRARFDMTNMTQIGQCGGDLYVFDENEGQYVLHDVVRFPFDGTAYEASLGHFENAPKKMRKYLFYFPLYMALEELSVGLDEGARVEPMPFSDNFRVAVYGTSITQGCGASRPGLAYTNILSRRLDIPVYNYGFSGSAFAEREMGEILGDRAVDLLFVDVEPNAGVDERLERNLDGFLNTYFKKQPKTCVVLYSRILFHFDYYDDYKIRLHAFYNKFLKDAAARYRKMGYKIAFRDGSHIIGGNFTEAFVDGIHPNDIGMMAIADDYASQLKKMRKKYSV